MKPNYITKISCCDIYLGTTFLQQDVEVYCNEANKDGYELVAQSQSQDGNKVTVVLTFKLIEQ